MESKKINQLATELSPDLSDLTIIGDPTTGISKKITLSQMASLFTGTVEEYANLAAFPLVGVADTIYIAQDTNIIYRWTGSAYVELSPNIVSSLVFNDANGFDGTIVLASSVATLTITTALTLGSLPFIGASGALTQDNANLFYDDTNNRLGIGTNAPTTPLDVFGSGIIARINGTSTNNGFLGFSNAGTNKWSVGNVQSDHRFRIYSEANSAELVSVLQTGEFGIGIANPLTKLHIDGGATALIANLDANVSIAKSISFRSDNSNRINLEVSGTESGSNVGADFFIRRYTDLGALIDTPLTITRSTGLITLATALSGTSATFSGALASTFVGQFLQNTGASTSSKIIRISNTGADMAIGIEGATPSEIPLAEGGIAYSTVLKAVGSTSLILGTLSKAAIVINTSQQVTLKQGLTGTTANFTGQLTLGSTITNGTYTYTLPSATGTLALTSALSSYLPLSGGTLTGALSGTSASFSGNGNGVTLSASTGTTNTQYKVNNTGGDNYFGVSASDGSSLFTGTTAYSGYIGTNNAYPLQLATGGIVRATITSAGYTWVNGAISGFTGSGVQFQVNGQSRMGGTIILHNTSNAAQTATFNCTAASTVTIADNVVIVGSLSKGSGSFRIEHPLPSLSETHQLVHSFVEAPQADLYYRGKLTLVNGKAQANIDEVSTMTEGTFEVLCREVQCFTTNESGWDLVKGKVIGNIIYIESQNQNSTDEISWMVIGERKDKHIMETNWTDENGKVIVEPLKPIEPDPIEEVNPIVEVAAQNEPESEPKAEPIEPEVEPEDKTESEPIEEDTNTTQ